MERLRLREVGSCPRPGARAVGSAESEDTQWGWQDQVCIRASSVAKPPHALNDPPERVGAEVPFGGGAGGRAGAEAAETVQRHRQRVPLLQALGALGPVGRLSQEQTGGPCQAVPASQVGS